MNHNVENDQTNSTGQTSATPPMNNNGDARINIKRLLIVGLAIIFIVYLFDGFDALGTKKLDNKSVNSDPYGLLNLIKSSIFNSARPVSI